MTEFDPIQARRQVIAGLVDIHKVLLTRAREAERRFTEAEADANVTLKLERFAAGLLDDERAKLQALEAIAEANAKAAT